jgi:hypothetical protein
MAPKVPDDVGLPQHGLDHKVRGATGTPPEPGAFFTPMQALPAEAAESAATSASYWRWER